MRRSTALATLLLTACLMVDGHGHHDPSKKEEKHEAKSIIKSVLHDENGTNKSNETALHDVEKELEHAKGINAPILIMGGLAFNMFFFYLVNARHQVIKDQTWTMLNMAVSIFCAVLFNSFWNMLIKYVFHIHEAHGHEAPTNGQVVSALCQMCSWYFSFTFVAFYLCSDTLLQLKGWGTIGGHIMGFGAIHLFGTLAETEAFRNNPWSILLCVVIFAAFWMVLMLCSQLIGKFIGRKMTEIEMERWHDQSKETGIDFFSLGAGFLISLWIRFLLIGHLPQIEQSAYIASTRDTVLLSCNAGLLLILGCVFATIRRMIGKKSGKQSCTWILINLVDHALYFAGAYVLLFALQWDYSKRMGHTVMARATVACVATFIAIFFILAMSCAFTKCFTNDAKPMFRGLFMALALCMGLSWEKTFDASIEGLVEHMHEHGTSARRVQMYVCLFEFFLFIVVFPAWMAYILPKSDPEIQEEYKGKPLPWYAAFCMPSDEEEESDEEDDDGERLMDDEN